MKLAEEMDRAIKGNFYGLEKPYFVLFVAEPKDYPEAMISLVRFLIESEKLQPVYITVNKSCVKLDEIFRINGINTDNLYFIDCISKMANPQARDSERAKYISSPENFKELTAEIEAITEKPKKNMVFLIDNISALLVYNKSDDVNKFVHFLHGKSELTNTCAIAVALKDEVVPKSIGQYADRIIEVKYVY